MATRAGCELMSTCPECKSGNSLFRIHCHKNTFHTLWPRMSCKSVRVMIKFGQTSVGVLGLEYCPGYTDTFGMWNTGFYCPEKKPNEPVYCCGTDTYKYCCTKRDVFKAEESGDDQPLIIAVSLGSLLVVALVTLITCLLYRWNHIRKRRHPIVNRGSLYRLHCSSATSDVTNMYSFSGQPSVTTTPGDAVVNYQQDDTVLRIPSYNDSLCQHVISNIPNALLQPSPHCPLVAGDPPPPYQLDNSYPLLFVPNQDFVTIPVSSSSNISFSRPFGSPTLSQASNTSDNDQLSIRNGYWSTKF
ncbi:uncharacterized protein LOC111087186 isoform X2 [Limulus polyphemus]|nr:uncharacterized protein LOC111087186 isoform X2 [Limulus polyphemus]XP_022248694.1 uncharacterized protein LOC111087186 isoform X2 [Limulus polyphemus]